MNPKAVETLEGEIEEAIAEVIVKMASRSSVSYTHLTLPTNREV